MIPTLLPSLFSQALYSYPLLRNQVLEEEGTDGSEWAWAESDVDPAIEGSIAHRLAAR